MKNLMHNKSGVVNIITEIEKKLTKDTCSNTTKIKSGLERDCPHCGCIRLYSNRSNFLKAIKKKSVCITCLNRKKVLNKEYIKKLSIAKLGERNPCKRDDVKLKISTVTKGKSKHSEEFKARMSLLHKGKITSDKTKKKMREAVLNKIKLYGKYARNFNPIACSYIDNINKMTGWNLIHALNGGEYIVIGYSLDGYDKERNIVFEYDEPKHFSKDGVLKEKDFNRMKDIILILACRFIRYNEKENKIIEYYVNENKINKRSLCSVLE
jgi:hypothetical protein